MDREQQYRTAMRLKFYDVKQVSSVHILRYKLLSHHKCKLNLNPYINLQGMTHDTILVAE